MIKRIISALLIICLTLMRYTMMTMLIIVPMMTALPPSLCNILSQIYTV